MHRLVFLARLLLVGLGIQALGFSQNCIGNSGNDPGTPGGNVPLLNLAGTGQFRRTQILVPAVFFQNVPTRVTDLSYYLGSGWRQIHFDEVTIKMGHTSLTTLTTNPVTNITSPLQTVLAVRDHVCFEGGGPGWLPVGLQTSFLYLPGSGNLLIEVVVKGGNTLAQQWFTGHWSVLYGSAVTGVDTTLPTVLGGPQQPPRLLLCTDRAESMLFGQSCQGSGTSTPLLGVSGRPTLGSSPTLWLSDAPPNAPAACAYGFDNAPPFPLLLTSLGAPGCRQYFTVAFADFVLADSVGVGSRTVSIPNAAATIGAIVYAQYFVLDPPANVLDITASNYARLLAGY